MPFEANTGLGGVANFYGARNTGGSVGFEGGDSSARRISIELTADTLANIGVLGPKFKVLNGMKVNRILLHVDQAFTLTGTNPVVNIGSAGSPATNGVQITQAELAAVGTKLLANQGNGTWSSTSTTGITADAVVVSALGGTTPAVTQGAGQATLIIEVLYKNRQLSTP